MCLKNTIIETFREAFEKRFFRLKFQDIEHIGGDKGKYICAKYLDTSDFKITVSIKKKFFLSEVHEEENYHGNKSEENHVFVNICDFVSGNDPSWDLNFL